MEATTWLTDWWQGNPNAGLAERLHITQELWDALTNEYNQNPVGHPWAKLWYNCMRDHPTRFVFVAQVPNVHPRNWGAALVIRVEARAKQVYDEPVEDVID
jgi:hypothetical protein